jgi:hypothetical protein
MKNITRDVDLDAQTDTFGQHEQPQNFFILSPSPLSKFVGKDP